jgi:hypothetical protein
MAGARWLISVLVAAVLFSPRALAQSDRAAEFPFVKGTVWTYAGTVRWTDSRNRPESRAIRWTSEAVDAFDRGDTAGVLLHGGVWDLAWWTPRSRPADYAVLRLGTRYYLIRDDATRVFARLKSSGRAELPVDAERDQRWFDAPLRTGRLLRPSGVAPRFDTLYGWLVERAVAVNLAIHGVPPARRTADELRYTTLPDEQRVTLVPRRRRDVVRLPAPRDGRRSGRPPRGRSSRRPSSRAVGAVMMRVRSVPECVRAPGSG